LRKVHNKYLHCSYFATGIIWTQLHKKGKDTRKVFVQKHRAGLLNT